MEIKFEVATEPAGKGNFIGAPNLLCHENPTRLAYGVTGGVGLLESWEENPGPVECNPLNLGDLNIIFAPSQDKQEEMIFSLLKFNEKTC
jgi:hypothetical protein